jgi:DinB family protein
MSERTEALARRLEQGADALIALASGLTESEWNIRIPRDGRKIGVVVHHVAFMYPLEIQLAQVMAKGEAVMGVTSATIDEINAKHAKDKEGVTKEEAIEAVRRNSAAAAAAIRALSDQELDQAATLSLNADAPLTTQFMLEDHAVRHSYHHAAKIRSALQGTVALRKVG